MLISLLLVQGLSFHPLTASLLSATFLRCQIPTDLGLEPSVSHICHFTQHSTVLKKSTYNSTQLPFFILSGVIRSFSRISPPPDQEAQSSPSASLSQSFPPPLRDQEKCLVRRTRLIFLQSSLLQSPLSQLFTNQVFKGATRRGEVYFTILPPPFAIPAYRQRDFFRHSYFDSLWLLDLHIAVTGSLEHRRTFGVFWTFWTVPYVARFVNFGCCSGVATATSQYWTPSYTNLSPNITDFRSPAPIPSPLLTLSKRAIERIIASFSLLLPHWYLNLSSCLFGFTSLLPSYWSEIISTFFAPIIRPDYWGEFLLASIPWPDNQIIISWR